MIVRSVEDLKASGSYREQPGVWSSARYLLRRDGVGFTLTETTVAAAQPGDDQYIRRHVQDLGGHQLDQITDPAPG